MTLRSFRPQILPAPPFAACAAAPRFHLIRFVHLSGYFWQSISASLRFCPRRFQLGFCVPCGGLSPGSQSSHPSAACLSASSALLSNSAISKSSSLSIYPALLQRLPPACSLGLIASYRQWPPSRCLLAPPPTRAASSSLSRKALSNNTLFSRQNVQVVS